MKTSIYISSEKIEAIGYNGSGMKISVKEYVTEPLPEGTVINGKIIDSPYLTECLTSLRKKHPKLFNHPALIVDGSSILSKRMETPKLTKRQCFKMVRDEFADSAENLETLVCDYYPLAAAANSRAVLACATEKSQVENYISTFKSAGIHLRAIRIGVQAILAHVASRPELQKTNFVLNIVDGLYMLSMIFNKGVNVFISRTRLYSEDYEQLIHDILDNLSGLIQFNKSEKFDDFLFSYYLGLKKEDIDFMNTINPYPDIELDTLDIFKKLSGAAKLGTEAHFACLSIQLGDDSIDLIRSCRTYDKIKKQERPKMLWIPLLAGIVVTFAIPTGYFYYRLYEVNAMTDDLLNYLNSEDVLSKSEEIDGIMSETAYYAGIANQLEEKLADENTRAAINNRVLDVITKRKIDTVTVTFFDFNESTGVMRVNGTSVNETESAAYVETLKRSDLIESVFYTGYSVGQEGECTFSIEVQLPQPPQLQDGGGDE